MCSRIAGALVTSALLCLVVPAASAQDRWRVDFENGASGENSPVLTTCCWKRAITPACRDESAVLFASGHDAR